MGHSRHRGTVSLGKRFLSERRLPDAPLTRFVHGPLDALMGLVVCHSTLSRPIRYQIQLENSRKQQGFTSLGPHWPRKRCSWHAKSLEQSPFDTYEYENGASISCLLFSLKGKGPRRGSKPLRCLSTAPLEAILTITINYILIHNCKMIRCMLIYISSTSLRPRTSIASLHKI